MISVIIPVYNGEKTIQATVASVQQQTFTDIEIIIINDGSTDKTLEIIHQIQDERIKIFNYENAGLSASRNRGISEASSELVAFIDADDLWTADKLTSQLQALENHPDADIAYSWTDYIDASGNFHKSGRRIKANGNIYQQLLLGNILENGSNPLIRKRVFEQVDGFDESLTAAEDWDMYLRLAVNYQFVCTKKVGVLYRVTANSMSTNLIRQEQASLTVINRGFNHPTASQLQPLKKQALANIYKYLLFRCLEIEPKHRDRKLAWKYLWQFILYDVKSYQQIRIIFIAIFQITLPQIYSYGKYLINRKSPYYGI